MTTIEPPSTPSIPALPLPSQRRTLTRASLLLSLLAIGCADLKAQSPLPGGQLTWHRTWRLTWQDEFNGPTGSPPDPSKWHFETGGKGYGNNELETYTDRSVNAHQQDGHLVITAFKEDHTGPDGIPRSYTSARLNTMSLFSQAYGRFEASIQLPTGKGIWPAFWLLGADIDHTPWPQSGEIDVIENIGDLTKIYSTLHGPGYSGAKALSAPFTLPSTESVHTAFHLYAVEWAPHDIKFFFDDHLIAHRTPADLPSGTHWVFDHPFFLILNLAVGGYWPGNPDATTTFPQQMLVDYVRVYSPDLPDRQDPAQATAKQGQP